MLNDYFSESILPRQKITEPRCPSCDKPINFDDNKMMQCCGLTAEAVLIIEPPPVEIIRSFRPNSASTPMIIDPYSIKPAMIPEREPRAESRKAWIGYLPIDGAIRNDVFRCFVDHQIRLPRCPRCRQPLEFRKDVNDTEKPFCSEEWCQVFLSPSHFAEGTVDKWKRYVRPFPLEADQFRLMPKAFNANFVEPHELRSISETVFLQHVAMFAATSVISEIEIDAIETQMPPIDNKNRDETQKRRKPQRDDSYDSCDAFIQNIITEDPSSFITRKAVYRAYEKWCEKTYSYCETRNVLFAKLRQIENVTEPRKRVDGEKPQRVFSGIRLL